MSQISFLPINIPDTLSALENRGSLLITASPQLAAQWKRRFILNHSILKHSQKVVATPTILLWNEWLSHLSRQLPDAPVPLNRTQELLLWEKIIRDDLNATATSDYTSAKGLAKRASEAYTRMQEYHINSSELTLGGEESEALARWIKAIRSALESGELGQRILGADLSALICPVFQNLNTPEQIILDGFETLTPAQQQLLESLKEHACKIFTVHSETETASPTLTPCPDQPLELHHVALRVQSLLDKDSSTTIAILTSDTFSDMDALRRELNKTVMPESCTDPFCDEQAVTMQPEPLSDWPMIQQTLHLLSLAGKKSLRFTDFSRVIFSPWIRGFEEEKIARATLDARFRQQNRHYISLNSLLESSELKPLPELHAALKLLTGFSTAKQSVNQWIKAVHTLLKNIGMVQAGLDHEAPRSNIEIKQMNAFRDTLSSLIAADSITDGITWPQFLSLLQSACSEGRSIRRVRYANCAVIPLTQVAGLEFDHIFLLGMDEQAFPPAARPQPLLPLPLQRKYAIAMSHGELQFETSRWLWQQLLKAAPQIEISYAEQRDQRQFQPSAFVKEFALTTTIDTAINRQRDQLETYQDSFDIPLQADEDIHGGASIIRNQSACPFRAFITHRLATTALGETEPGIEASTKGSLVHLALEFIWKRVKSQSTLLALDEDEYSELITGAIEHAWQKNRSSHNFAIQDIEKKRMRRLLNQWLELEAARVPFEVIETEQNFTLQLPEYAERQFSLHLNADRIDRDQHGRKILIDYKTGRKQSATKWLGARMEEPQLPLYAVAAALGEHDAVTFATIRSGDEMGFEGLSGEDTEIKGIAICDGKRKRPDDWQELLKHWRDSINTLAGEFVEGVSDVLPRDSKACQYCGLEALCRIDERGFDQEYDDETGEQA